MGEGEVFVEGLVEGDAVGGVEEIADSQRTAMRVFCQRVKAVVARKSARVAMVSRICQARRRVVLMD